MYKENGIAWVDPWRKALHTTTTRDVYQCQAEGVAVPSASRIVSAFSAFATHRDWCVDVRLLYAQFATTRRLDALYYNVVWKEKDNTQPTGERDKTITNSHLTDSTPQTENHPSSSASSSPPSWRGFCVFHKPQFFSFVALSTPKRSTK